MEKLAWVFASLVLVACSCLSQESSDSITIPSELSGINADVDGDGKATYADKLALALWRLQGGDLGRALAAAKLRSDGVVDFSPFFSDRANFPTCQTYKPAHMPVGMEQQESAAAKSISPRVPHVKRPLSVTDGYRHSVTVKFTDDSRVRIGPGNELRSNTEADVSAANLLARQYGFSLSSVFSAPDEKLEEAEAACAAKTGVSWPDLGGFMYVLTDNEINERLIAIGNALQDLAFVEYVEITPVCDILPGDIGEDTPDLEQYLWASPSMFDPDPGMWFNALRAYFGTVYLFEGKGRGVDVYDVECAWRTSHEDLQALTWTTESGQIPHSSVLQNVDFIDHGTAVLGIIAADEDLEWATGLRGLASEVDAHLYPTFRGSRT